MIDDKNQIIRSMKSYNNGGAFDVDKFQLGGCNYSKAARKNKRQKAFRNFGEKAGKVVGAVAGIGAGVAAGIGIKKMLDKQKKGGPVKKKK